MQGDDVGLGANFALLCVTTAKGFKVGRRILVVANHLATESQHDSRKNAPDLAGPDHSGCLAVQIEAHQTIEREVGITGPVVGPVNLTVNGEKEGNGMFCD